jgi:hypothetical protein
MVSGHLFFGVNHPGEPPELMENWWKTVGWLDLQRVDCGGWIEDSMYLRLRLWGSWTECLPTHNGYCPTDCPAATCLASGWSWDPNGSQSLRFSMRCAAMAKGEVACDLVEDYLPNGTSLGWVQPSVKCAASHDQCPCRGAQWWWMMFRMFSWLKGIWFTRIYTCNNNQ